MAPGIPTEACPGCGLVLPRSAGPTHPYIGASAACWALYGEVLAREFQDRERFGVHQLTVDTYAVQHPGTPEPRAARSVALHLATLALFLERGADPARGPLLHRRLVGRLDETWLEPPSPNGTLTVADVHRTRDAAAHRRAVEAWARDVWAAWAPHHAIVRGRLGEAL